MKTARHILVCDACHDLIYPGHSYDTETSPGELFCSECSTAITEGTKRKKEEGV